MRCIQLGFGDTAETEIETLGRNAMPMDSGPSDQDRDKNMDLVNGWDGEHLGASQAWCHPHSPSQAPQRPGSLDSGPRLGRTPSP